ncbi:MalY/PatB family protein [Anaerolentibacter hominis]|uniref:MalY/PatB family protein n=1 Tax=Anaerolentibacter hominis TaxID=3079009 RepID=UPI0031B7F022
MQYNFDEIIDRSNTGSLKYDFKKDRGMPEDVIPMWVADMDFRSPKEVRDAVVRSAEHGIFGYSEATGAYTDAVRNWYRTRFGWDIRPEWMVRTPGIVFAIAMAIRAFTRKGDGVLIQQPVYYPFSACIEKNERRLVNNALRYEDGRYSMDFEDMERKITEENVKLFLLCSPHNPVGRVWSEEELKRAGEICLRHGVVVVSDEIHSDFVWGDRKHVMFGNISPELRDISVTCTAPSKTFNIAGLQVSNIFIPNETLRAAFETEMEKTGYSQLNQLGMAAAAAAYEKGGEWLSQVKEYLEKNLEFVRNFVKDRLPELCMAEPEGTYLVWLDFNHLSLTREQRDELIVGRAKLWLDEGDIFGAGGEGFERFNIACPRQILEQAFLSLEKALRNR